MTEGRKEEREGGRKEGRKEARGGAAPFWTCHTALMTRIVLRTFELLMIMILDAMRFVQNREM